MFLHYANLEELDLAIITESNILTALIIAKVIIIDFLTSNLAFMVKIPVNAKIMKKWTVELRAFKILEIAGPSENNTPKILW